MSENLKAAPSFSRNVVGDSNYEIAQLIIRAADARERETTQRWAVSPDPYQ